MLKRFADDEMSVAELSQPFEMSKSAVTKHPKVLEKAGLLNRTVSGRVHHCRMDAAPLEAASKWMTFYKAFWNDKFDALDSYLIDNPIKGE